ncbi:MAG: SCO family protein [Oligoflexus sp.]
MPKKLILSMMLLFVIIVPITSYFITQQIKTDAIVNGRAIEPSRPLREFKLTDSKGQPFKLASLIGHWTVLSFGFTHCPDVCPATLAYYRDEIEFLEDKLSKTQFVFVSVDPDRDRLEILDEYVRAFHPKIKGVTGSEEELQNFVKMFGAYFAKEGSGEGYQVAHTPYLFLIDPEGRWKAFYVQPLGRGKVAMDLARLIF